MGGRWIMLGAALGCGTGSDPEEAPEDSGVLSAVDTGARAPDFEADVFPILEAHCAGCHDNDFHGDFSTPDLAYRALTDPDRFVGPICGWPAEDWVPLLEPGDREGSGLWRVIVGTCDDGDYGMPTLSVDGFLADFDPDAAERIGAWIDAGARRGEPALP